VDRDQREQREQRYRFVAAGREYHSGFGVGGPAEACGIAREAARKTPNVEHAVHERDGKLLAAYKLVAGRMTVRMP
jgi:hypothetical protein